ncbi:MAG TPA: hypothetical protein VJ385_04810 [Fibrobacteria bacterium]|nr:hypothetical protein [Fibrobacteria bacterium]
MQKSSLRLASSAFLSALVCGFLPAAAQKILTLETTHYRVGYEKRHEQLAGEVLKVAEAVWPTLAKAYDGYNHFQRIDIWITDNEDEANGHAFYNFSQVEIFAPHIDWVMRNRQLWVRNVVTHELAHIFSLRRAAFLSPVDAVELYGSTYNYADKVNYSFHFPWIPLVAPTWYVEGIAQFEAYMNDNDSWDSQRDMVLRDAYLTGTLPTLDFIEMFESDEDGTQSERCYNTGYAFLIYLKDRFGADKVRDLARPKPLANFSWSVYQAFGRDLTDLFEDFKRSLADRYADFKDIAPDPVADKDMVGSYQQNLAFSPDGKYMAWLGNAENRRYPLNWIYWKPVDGGRTIQSSHPVDKPATPPIPASPAPSPTPGPGPDPVPDPRQDGFFPGGGPLGYTPGAAPRLRFANPVQALGKGYGPRAVGPARFGASATGYVREKESLPHARRSEEFGSAGLEFNHDNTRLLTTRRGEYAQFTDIWEYEFRADKSEDDKWHRLTWEERAVYPSYHPAKNLIVYSRKKNGSSNLALLDSTGRTWQLTNFSNGEQVYNPRFTPKGDSIYFTLGILDKEAIVSISADAAGFNPFLALKDSALFPDTLLLAKNRKINFVTPMKAGAFRHLRFENDTLFWSSNALDTGYSVYDVYARLPGDSAIYRATRVAGQAMEPLAHDGSLYYQGYRKQQFRIFRRPLALTRTDAALGHATDTLPLVKPKKEDFTKVFETGEMRGAGLALDITPFLSVQPTFISGDRSYTDLALGLNVAFGEAGGGWSQSVSGAVTKRSRLDAPLNYQFSYSGYLGYGSYRHTTDSWSPSLYYSLYHDVVESNTEDVLVGGFRQGVDTVSYVDREFNYASWKRYAASAVMPLPYNFQAGGSYFKQELTLDFAQSVRLVNLTAPDTQYIDNPRSNFLRDAPQHRNFEANLGWGWSKGMLGTFLPTGGGLWGQVRRYWATYSGKAAAVDSLTLIERSLQGKPTPQAALTQQEFDPWTVDAGGSGIVSIGRHLSLFANVEGGAFLNRFPTVATPANLTFNATTNGYDTTITRELEPSLWVISYRLGYYRMSGYPYNFTYRGRDIMEGSAYTFGQAGVQIPLKTGFFLPGWPTTSWKQIMLTGLGEWGTTLSTRPNHLYRSLVDGEQYLLLDYGARLAFNFRLYHQLPFSVFGQVFFPWNNLKAAHLYWYDYGHTGAPKANGDPGEEQLANDAADRKRYIDQVKQPRFFVGFNLGIF